MLGNFLQHFVGTPRSTGIDMRNFSKSGIMGTPRSTVEFLHIIIPTHLQTVFSNPLPFTDIPYLVKVTS